MQIIGLFLSLVILSGYYFSENAQSVSESQNSSFIDSITSSITIYSSYVQAYAQNNPTFNGQANALALKLPTWFNPAPQLSHYISNGTSYVYYTNPTSGMASSLSHKTSGLTAGTVQAGTVYSPAAGNTGITVPATIPNGSLVFIR